MTVTRGKKSANTTPKKVAKETPKTTPKKTPTKKPATPTKSTPKKAATPKSTPKKATTPKSTPKKAATTKATPKKTKEAAPEAESVTPATSAPTTPKSKKTSAKSTPVKATKNAPTSKPTTPVKASKTATPKTPKKAAETKEAASTPKATPKRKAAATTASPAKKAKSGAISEGAIKKPIPSDMIVQDHEAKEWNLYELAQNHGLVIFAYPAASTPGCTKQVCFFRDAFNTFADKGFKVFGLSNDSSKKNATFYTKQKLNYPLISDPQGKLISFLGIGKDASHKAQRSAFVIPQGGELMYCNPSAGPEPSKDWAQNIVLGL